MAPEAEKFVQSLALLVQSVFKPVTVTLVTVTVVWTAAVNGKVNTPFDEVVPITVVPSDLLYSLLALRTQSVCSLLPPLQFAVVHAIRLVPSATRAL